MRSWGQYPGGGKRADGGYQNLYDLYLELENEKKQAVSALSPGGYDYGRIYEYEQSMEDAARYQSDLESWQEYANEHPVLASVDSLLVAPFRGFDFLRAAGQNIGHSNPDEPDSYVPMNSLQYGGYQLCQRRAHRGPGAGGGDGLEPSGPECGRFSLPDWHERWGQRIGPGCVWTTPVLSLWEAPVRRPVKPRT